MTTRITRRELFILGSLAAGVGGTAAIEAAEPTPLEKANMKVVTETSPPVVGRDAIRERIRTFLERADKVEFAVSDSIAKGPIVLNERVDTFVSPQRMQRFHLVGMFFLVDGKIAEWTDYLLKD
jgi:limonene-1,2-epoxide hydrolase